MLMRTIRLLEALQASDWRRARYVQALSFPSAASGTGELMLIGKILSKTANLNSLKLHTLSNFSFERGQFFQENPTFTLTTLHLSSDRSRYDKALLVFLESQTSLESLHLRLSSYELEDKHVFSAASFPRLRVLYIHSSLVPNILRTSARLTHLRLTGHHDWPEPEYPDELCAETVRTLSCQVSAETAVASMLSLFSNIEWLSGPFNTASLDDLCSLNHKLRGISFAELPPSSGFSQDEMARAFRTRPTLQFIEYAGSGGRRYRWYRGATSPMAVRWLCTPDEEWLADWEEEVVNIE
ncbi:hypothetical protein EYR40_009402 [Pleurotus pulmonarius]|nr:hypothetical protein EYR40_009402 [Pleurotus pulmonarius]